MLALYQILLRTGWIFKTESIIMPAVLDTLSGLGSVRGWLPVLNRFGYSIPPLLMARRIKVAGHKTWPVFTTTVYMTASFLGMAAVFRVDQEWFRLGMSAMFGVDEARFRAVLPASFLLLYAIFFTAMGVNQLAFTTLQGKLIAPHRRGRLLLLSNTIGAVSAIGCALWLMPGWLKTGAPRFDLIFGFSGLLFAISGLATLFTRERPDAYTEPPAAAHLYFLDALRVLRNDAAFRRLSFVAAMYGSSLMLFPHYQNLGLRGMKLELIDLMWWVVIQNLGTGLFSIPAGPLADHCGNRLVVRLGMLTISAAPLLALSMLFLPRHARLICNLLFFCVGVTPVVLRNFQNFALELSRPEDHPRYLSTISLMMAAPIVVSPLAGWLVDEVGHGPVFAAVAGLVLLGWLATFGLHEPRWDATRSPGDAGNNKNQE